MIKSIKKSARISLCQQCHGTGLWKHADSGDPSVVIAERCPQCLGSGRVTVSVEARYDIRPWKDAACLSTGKKENL